MKPQSIKSYPKKLLLKKPIKVAGNQITEREILELEIQTDSGALWSEISHLNGLHGFTLADFLKKIQDDLTGYKDWSDQLSYPIDVALFSLASPKLESGSIYINGYYDLSMSEEAPAFHCLKVKIGRSNFDNEIERLKSLKKRNLRLDANRSLNQKQFKSFIENIKHYDYFEEPFQNKEDFKTFPNEKFALDENVEDLDLQALPQITTFVLKPTLLGMAKTISLIEKAKIMGKRVVISSTFEGEIGLTALAKIALHVDLTLGHKEQHGLGTISFLKDPLKNLRISIDDNSIALNF